MIKQTKNKDDMFPELTNEEKKVSVYSSLKPVTKANTVSPDTPLEDLNLNWSERDLPEKERTKHVHRLHPYLGKFIPQLVEVFLRKYFLPGQTVLDPFCGSGTALVQANELGINSIGYDISAFNILLCRAKLGHYDIKRAKFEITDTIAKLRAMNNAAVKQGKLWDENLPQSEIPGTDDEYLRNWFAPRALSQLLMYRDLINSGNYQYKDLLKIILCRSARSARLTTHYDLDFPKIPQIEPYWCYKHQCMCTPVEEALRFLQRYSIDTLYRIEEFSNLRSNAKYEINHEDSRIARFPNIDGIITSPPYVGLIDYHDQHAYAYNLLGLEDRRRDEIGPAVNGSSAQAKQKYQLDIARVFQRAIASMTKGGRIVVVVHDRSELYSEIARQCNVEIEAVLQRHVNRRTGRRTNEFYESVLIWRKP